ncbi:Signal peptide peptidase-like 2A [Varanus komodoensis]|nr:Signal peptide peptidase-like 2A [Varanus komodoensis]
MKPLGEVIRRCGLRNHQYADDTQLYFSFSTNPGEAVAVLNWCLAKVMGWMRANKLKLNPDKTEVLLVGGSNSWVGDLGLVLNGVALPLRDRVRSLGVLLDPELSLEAQVTAVARSAFLQLRLIHQLRPFLENDCLATVTHALVTSRLVFCNALYVGLPLKTSCVLLLGLLLLYDVFFVFITPFITKNGESIMVEVATGPSENSEKSDGNLVEASAERSAPHENLPVVIKVPKLIFSGTMLCQMPFSLLGYGDIVLPGLLVAYCHRFDIQTRSSRVYFISCTIAYAVGMLVTFLSLSLMKMAQPALLYLVPCTLLSSTLVALYRKEMKKFWNGNNYQAMDFAASEENPTRASEQHGGQ